MDMTAGVPFLSIDALRSCIRGKGDGKEQAAATSLHEEESGNGLNLEFI